MDDDEWDPRPEWLLILPRLMRDGNSTCVGDDVIRSVLDRQPRMGTPPEETSP